MHKMESIKINKSREKIFTHRNSVLTEILQNKNAEIVYKIIKVILIIHFTSHIGYFLLGMSVEEMNLKYISNAFINMDLALFLWFVLFVTSLIMYKTLEVIAFFRIELQPKSQIIHLYDFMCLILAMTYFILFFYLGAEFAFNKLSFASGVFFSMEHLRFGMKNYAIVRSITPRILKYKLHEDKNLELPGLKRILYFLFAPTLIYKDEYPRTEKIRWNLVLRYFLESLALIYMAIMLCLIQWAPKLPNFGLNPYTWKTVFILVIENSILGLVTYVLTFLFLLHTWQNLFAELLQFGDRQFYSDWWNARSYNEYFRTWNIIVHDFLFHYIYKDVYGTVTNKNKIISLLAVFLISALGHEYVIMIATGFLYPVGSTFFLTTGLFFTIFKKYLFESNLFVLSSYALGVSIFLSTYSMEYYARINCPVDNYHEIKFYAPKMWSCKNYIYN